ncbi:DUF262 domain-containing protein [Brevibacterium aurantiacum]|uniref:DUF262 domain-containing protein n=1 Tax=Brevibacterium aurantiacum TaxID=273384 RepID=UPI000DF4449D|nr:DUF262 domain-containing protein [Brevibacterium aurantiacum]RCS97777.1 DUF262 domain-containing protein [Brevibacterium aurantiacum]
MSDFTGLEEQLNVERRKVDVGEVSFSVREIVRMYEEGDLTIAPAYQRKYRWPAEIASKFIESLFLGLPIPPVFVATNDDFEWEVVDGLQRISTLIYFVSTSTETLSAIGRTHPLKLSGLNKLTQLNDISYVDLPVNLQRYLNRQPIQLTSLTDKSDKEVRFDLFERLNSGAIALTPQEVRSSVYKGKFIDFLETLSENRDLQSLLKLQTLNQSDGTAAEQVLKFYAYKNSQNSFNGAVSKFLNDYTAETQSGFDYQNERQIFEEAMNTLSSILQGGYFLRKNTNVTPLVQFEACAVAVGQIIEKGEIVIPPSGDWINDKVLVDSSTGGTNTKAMLRRRIERAVEIFSGNE